MGGPHELDFLGRRCIVEVAVADEGGELEDGLGAIDATLQRGDLLTLIRVQPCLPRLMPNFVSMGTQP